MHNVVVAVTELRDRFSGPLSAVETGTIRTYTEKHESTRHIAETLGDRGTLTSVDMSPEAIAVSKDICSHLSNVVWIEADSISYLSGLRGPSFHFAFLDSANDQDVIFEEFKLVVPLMFEEGVIMIDDAGITSTWQTIDEGRSTEKGHRVWPFLRSCRAGYTVLRTPRGHGTQLRIDCHRTNLRTLGEALQSEAA